MGVEPSEDNVKMLVAFGLGLDEATARRYLRVKQNDVDQAANAVMDGEDIDKLEKDITWDEKAFATGRDGEANLRPLGASAGPTRGPSPAPSLGIKNPMTHAEEQNEFDAALAASRASAGLPYQQEMGTVTSDGKEVQFGPANRPNYDPSQWAMTLSSAAVASEIVPDVDVLDRANAPGEPRLLKHLPDGDYTPNLLTILHAIPAAREALLLRDHLRSDYGEDAEWWHGHPIPLPRIVHVGDGAATEPDTDRHDEFIAEVQRLMAYLDAGARSYATIGALTETGAIKAVASKLTHAYPLMNAVLEEWLAAVVNRSARGAEFARLFNTIGRSTSDHDALDTPTLHVIDMSVTSDKKTQLGELLDDLIWGTDSESALPENYIEQPAEIIIIRLTHHRYSAAQLGVEIPATLVLDKYLEENITASRIVRQQVVDSRKMIGLIETEQDHLRYIPNPKKPNEKLDAYTILQHTLGHYTGANKESGEGDDVVEDVGLPPHYAQIAAQLQSAMGRIDDKLKRLAEEKERLLETISNLARSPLPGLQEQQPKHRYSLRGVATKPNITYVLRPKVDANDEEDMIVFSENERPASEPMDTDDTTPTGMQWWRLDYEVTGISAKITKTKTPDYDVLRAAELEHNSALLIYASASATDPPSGPSFASALPAALQTFVDRDNQAFKRDLDAERTRPPTYHSYSYEHPIGHGDDDIPQASIEKDQPAGGWRPRAPSTDSTRVQGGDSPTGSAHHEDWETELEQHAAFGLGYGPGGAGGVSVVQRETKGFVFDDDDDDDDDEERLLGDVEEVRGTARGEEEDDVVNIVLEDEPMHGAESQQGGGGGGGR